MKKQNLIIFIPSLIIPLVLVVFANSCKKDEENNTVTPVLLTIEVTAITQTTANCGGNITSDGGATVTARGVCWSTGQTPTVSDNKTTDGTGTGSFTSSISGLSANTTYYVRAYATNSNGTSYGNTCTFTTHINTPTVSTKDVTDISHSTAVSGGIISFEGETTITARGVCWSTEQAPTISDNKTIDGVGIGEFSTNLTGLSPGVNYFVRAYAEYNDTCIYGNEKTFNTLDLTEPIVSTKQISNIRSTTANCGGYISSDGGSEIISRGVVWNTIQNPTIEDNKTIDGTGVGYFTSAITDLSIGVTYYVRAYATNSIGTVYGEQKTFATAYGIGETYNDGIVFYVDSDGGLIAQQSDMTNNGQSWGGARIMCENAGWRLATKDELNILYNQRNIVGGFSNFTYWSSSLFPEMGFYWAQNFSNGQQVGLHNSGSARVRCVKSY